MRVVTGKQTVSTCGYEPDSVYNKHLQTCLGWEICKYELTNEIQSKPVKLTFYFTNGNSLAFYHNQECCEFTYIEDIAGSLDDLLNHPLLECSIETNQSEFKNGSATWTFYKFSTIKGSVTIRWYGESNGYYSEYVTTSIFIADNSITNQSGSSAS